MDAEAELTCPICYGIFDQPVRWPAQPGRRTGCHLFCRACLHRCMTEQHTPGGRRACPMCREPAANDCTAEVIRHLPVDSVTSELIALHMPHVWQQQRERAKREEEEMACTSSLMLIGVSREILSHTLCRPSTPRKDSVNELIILQPRHFVILARALSSEGRFGIILDGDSGSEGERRGLCCSVVREKWASRSSPCNEEEWLDLILHRARTHNGAVSFKFVCGSTFALIGPLDAEPLTGSVATRFHNERRREGKAPAELAPISRGHALLVDPFETPPNTPGRVATGLADSPATRHVVSLRTELDSDDFLERLRQAEQRDARARGETWRGLTSSRVLSTLRRHSNWRPACESLHHFVAYQRSDGVS